jgi:hypothetical protein
MPALVRRTLPPITDSCWREIGLFWENRNGCEVVLSIKGKSAIEYLVEADIFARLRSVRLRGTFTIRRIG